MKKKMKKVFLGTMVALCAMAFAGCGSNSTEDTTDKKENANEDTGSQETAKDGLKIAVVTSPSGVDDGNFNQEVYNGVLSFIDENPDATVKTVREESGSPDAAVQAVADIVADYDVIVANGYQFAGIGTIAESNPDKKFILVDSFPTNAEGEETVYDNVYAMTFAEQEGGFFAGIAAAMETKTNKVAVVNGIAFPSNVNYQYGFEAGVNYANKHLNTAVEYISLPSYAGTDVTGANVGGNYVGDFSDEATGKVVGKALIDQGVDIMFVAAGASGNGVFTAVKEADGIKVIGCDVDQYADGANGDDNIILTSVLKLMGRNAKLQLSNILDDSFKGENALLSTAEDSMGFVSEEHHQMSDDTVNALTDVLDKMKKGEIVPPSNFSDSTVDNFTGL